LKRLAFLSHPECLKHVAPYNHPESPDRVKAVGEKVLASTLTGRIDFFEAEPAKLIDITAVHPLRYVKRLQKSCEGGETWFDYEDTYINSHSFLAAMHSAGGAVEGVKRVLSGEYDRAFCCVRPPGHHAEQERGMGFCLFNNVSIAAKYARGNGGSRRVMIVDWDVHHGNGTQDIFQKDPTVFYFSIHEHPTYLFPGTGRRWDTGKGKGAGSTMNVPLLPGSGDEEYIQAFETQLVPTIKVFNPDLILISAGFDAHGDDSMSDMTVTEGGFGEMTRLVREASERYSNGKIVSILEGGYQIDALVASVLHHLKELTVCGREVTCSFTEE